MAQDKVSIPQYFKRGLITENPVLRLMLGTCPTLAISTTLSGAIGMGVSATLVLICSNIVISALRKVIPDKVRIPAYIVIIASFVTIVQLLVKAFLPSIDQALGIYLPLIVVNCIILGRAEAFANSHPVPAAALDGLTMGIGFTAAISLMAIIREILGAGTLLDTQILPASFPPITIFILPPGGFFVFGILVALANKLAISTGREPMQLNSCAGCPGSEACAEFRDVDEVATDEIEPKARPGRDPATIAYDHSAQQASQYDKVNTGDLKHRSIEIDAPSSASDDASEVADNASEQKNTEV